MREENKNDGLVSNKWVSGWIDGCGIEVGASCRFGGTSLRCIM